MQKFSGGILLGPKNEEEVGVWSVKKKLAWSQSIMCPTSRG